MAGRAGRGVKAGWIVARLGGWTVLFRDYGIGPVEEVLDAPSLAELRVKAYAAGLEGWEDAAAEFEARGEAARDFEPCREAE